MAAPCSNHMLVMEPALVLTALNEFTRQQINKKSGSADETKRLVFFKEQTIGVWRNFKYKKPPILI